MPVNGSLHDSIAIDDRGFSYGDGVFETIRLQHQKPLLFKQHMDRLASGSERLKIPLNRELLEREISQLAAEFPQQGILKIIVTRGVGGRGYKPASDNEPTRVLSLHPLPDYDVEKITVGVDVVVCKLRLAIQPVLAGIKHLNRLEQVLAAMELHQDQFLEGLMLDMEENVIEGTRSNIFWAESGSLKTPSLNRSGVAGIMRNFLLAHIKGSVEESQCSLDRLFAADEVFLCNSIFGIWPVKKIQSGKEIYTFDTDAKSRHFSAQAMSLFDRLLTDHGD